MAETSNEIILDLRLKIFTQAERWRSRGEVISRAYTAAFSKQQAVLNSIKTASAETVAKERAMMAFFLGLITGGIVGQMTGALAANATTRISRSTLFRTAVEEATRDHVLRTMVGPGLKTLIEGGGDKLKGIALSGVASAPNSDSFVPVERDPTVVGSLIRQSISDRTIILQTIAESIYDVFKDGGLPQDAARRIRTSFLYSPFFMSLPPGEVDESVLVDRAHLALWIAWGRVRDKKYWDGQHDVIVSERSEVWVWSKRLLPELVRLGAPASRIQVWVDKKTIALNMPGFIEWSRGHQAVMPMFAGLPADVWGMSNAINVSATKPN